VSSPAASPAALPAPRPHSTELVAFAEEVGPSGPVAVAGGRTRWEVGGPLAKGCRVVAAPVGVVTLEPADLTVRVRAGTTVADLHAALSEVGQVTSLDDRSAASTVGGALAVGWSSLRAAGWGPIRDALLEVTYVSSDGRLVRAGGPTVKNVSGFDLCRLVVGSLGTIGLIAEVVLRTRPSPPASMWWSGQVDDPLALRDSLHQPSCLLWDGRRGWVLLDGHQVDVEAEGAVCEAAGLSPAAGPPDLPPHRWSCSPADTVALRAGEGRVVVEVGVGVVHTDVPPPPPVVERRLAQLHARLRERFDPHRRLNPGREVLSW
jgi:glycolate oxidase FAD binding subunit